MKQDLYDTFYLSVICGFIFIISTTFFGCEVQAQVSRAEIETAIVRSAVEHGLDPKLALAIVEVESQFNPNAIGSIGEIGLFQLRPEFHSVVPGRPNHNIQVAIKYLVKLKRRCSHYGDAFFVCYNYGAARRLKHPKLFPYYIKVQDALARRQGTDYVVATTD